MDSTRRIACRKDLLELNPLYTTVSQIFCLLVVSHLFNELLRPLSLPGPIAQILAGLIIGPTGLSRIPPVARVFLQDSAADYYEVLSMFACILFMFLIAIELDISYTIRRLRAASIIAAAVGLMCGIFSICISVYLYLFFNQSPSATGNTFTFGLVIMLIIANSATPVVTRLAKDLRLATSDVGQLAITTSLIIDLACLVLYSMRNFFVKFKRFGEQAERTLISTLIIGLCVPVTIFGVRWLNHRNRSKKYLNNAEFLGFFAFLIGVSMVFEVLKSSSVLFSFILGMLLPRHGKTTRTLSRKLTYCVNTFILPIFFGYTGFQANFTALKLRHWGGVIIIILLSIGGRIGGTVAACHHLKIPMSDGVVIAFLLNMKGFVDLQFIGRSTSEEEWSKEVHNLLIVSVVLNTLLAGPLMVFILRGRDNFSYKSIALALHKPDDELRILACVDSARHAATMVGLIETLSGCQKSPIVPNLTHLVELPKTDPSLLFNQVENIDDFADEDHYGGNDVLEINEAVDAFVSETGIVIRQDKIVTSYATMYEHICNKAEDIRAAIILLPFHKTQRIDGKLDKCNEGVRATNQKVLRHAPCSVGILVDRGLGGKPKEPECDRKRVAALFFGGPDDREALSFSKRIGMNSRINLTVIRFQPSSSKKYDVGIGDGSRKTENVLMAISSLENENEVDNAFLEDFYNRYVASGQVAYVEKYVNNGIETRMALRDMADMYSLFIIGKAGRGSSPLTTGLSDWEECPEIGTVGDLLASSELDILGSILIIQ